MGDCDTVALRHEGKAAHARRRGEGLDRAIGIAGADVLAAGPGDRAVIPRGERVDPCAFLTRDLLDAAIGRDSHHAAIIAAGDELFTRRNGNENGGIGMRGDPPAMELPGGASSTVPSSNASAGICPRKAAAATGAPASSGVTWAASEEVMSCSVCDTGLRANFDLQNSMVQRKSALRRELL